jgi:hypothetical protein
LRITVEIQEEDRCLYDFVMEEQAGRSAKLFAKLQDRINQTKWEAAVSGAMRWPWSQEARVLIDASIYLG